MKSKDMKVAQQKQQLTFHLAEMLTMVQRAGRYPSGKRWSKWSQIFKGTDGVLYQSFQSRAIRASKEAAITGIFSGVSPFLYKGEKVIQLKNARIAPQEIEAEALSDNTQPHPKEDPFWWVVEGREHLLEDEPHQVYVAEALTPEQKSALNWEEEYYQSYRESQNPKR